uniref:PDZ domain-containing protein n=1 Tax=Oryza meridionalis TaxID=40149 RepID=A0A0E0DLY1_9ORYZ
MAPGAAGAEEASGSVKTRSSARRRRSVNRDGGSGVVASLASQSAARAERSERRSAKRSATLADQSSEGERAAKKMDLGVHEEEEGVKVAPPSASASVAEEQQGGKGGEDDGFGGSAGGGEGGALALPSASGVEEGIPVEDEASSCCSSPLRKPYIPRVVIGHNAMGREIYKPIGGEDFRALDPWEAKYQAKRDCQMKLPTLLPRVPDTCLTDRNLLHIRESSTKTVLHAAKFVVGLSSTIDGKSLSKSSGFMIDWDEKSKTGTILTSALLICKQSPSLDDWKSANQYASNAKVVVRFVDGTTVEGHFLYCQEHYNLAFYKIVVDRSIHLPSFNEGVKWAEEVFILGRDENSYLRTSYGRVQYLNPHMNERRHYVYIDGFSAPPEYYNGGPVIDLRGDVVGMSIRSTRGCIPRPHLQMKFWGMKFLNPAHLEVISCKCNIDEGLIVKEVSEGSIAEKLGVRVGDVIKFFNGKHISSTVELELLLLQISEDHFYNGNGLDSKIDIVIGVFHTRSGVWRSRKLTVHVSDKGEVVIRERQFMQDVHLTKQIQIQAHAREATRAVALAHTSAKPGERVGGGDNARKTQNPLPGGRARRGPRRPRPAPRRRHAVPHPSPSSDTHTSLARAAFVDYARTAVSSLPPYIPAAGQVLVAASSPVPDQRSRRSRAAGVRLPPAVRPRGGGPRRMEMSLGGGGVEERPGG